jgi:diaminohydroxyphosphoribosylaminopyrimidine deaminase/5-amino-6-(5-phosphoribosylamino)uracil reductase
VVFDRRARLPLQSALVRSARDIPVVDITDGSDPAAEEKLRAVGVEVVQASTLAQGLGSLRQAGVLHLLVEGGATLASAFLAAGFVDRLITFQAPVILGAGALPAFAALPSRAVETAPRLRVVARRECGNDLMTTYAVSGD